MNALLLFLFTGWCSTSALEANKPHYDIDKAELYFNYFITEYNKIYKTDAEKAYRFKIFKTNLEKVNIMNKDDHHAVYGITPFMDVTVEEIMKKHTGLRNSSSDFNFEKLKNGDIKYDPNVPDAFDWRDKGVVTRVKDQGDCGSSWAFSVIGHVESLYAIKYGKTLELSEQQFIDCTHTADGCCGSNLLIAFVELFYFTGIMQAKDYPYQKKKSRCGAVPDKFVASLADVESNEFNTQEAVKQLLYQYGPLPISISANSLHTYHHGILSDDHCSSGPINHAALLVGYGSENNVPYWIVKNSWGEKFGEAGYFRMPRGENAYSCGMMTKPIYTAILN